jgi:multiple sugar transport system substrate-binding protein
VTDDARKLGFDPSYTYPAVGPLIMLEGRQYRFPCNVAVPLYWVNKATFAKYGQPIPPTTWDFDTFERVGKAFVAAANKPGERPKVFFSAGIDRNMANVLRRSYGLDIFNETLTRCTLDDPRYVQTLERIRQWTLERLIPTAADAASFATEAGFGGVGGGPALQLFNSGSYGMVLMGRYALIQLRQFGAMDLSVSELPCAEFRNALIATRAAGIYAGSEHKDLAKLFLAVLASEEYNSQIVEDADALPPNPKQTQTEAFLRPPEHPNEWGCHEAFTKAAMQIAIPPSASPFVLPSVVDRLDDDAFQAFITSGRLTAAAAARQAATQINNEIDRTLRENPALHLRYQELLRRQSRIDADRAQGKKVPLEWIENPFHRRYYQAKGWAE